MKIISCKKMTELKKTDSLLYRVIYRGADKSLARPGRKQATTTEDFEFHISYL